MAIHQKIRLGVRKGEKPKLLAIGDKVKRVKHTIRKVQTKGE